MTTPVVVHGRKEPFSDRVAAPEDPGRYCFPPFASCITGAARLMLAMLERCVTDLGGTWAFCDTDSMAIVATDEGGLVPCPGGPESTAGRDGGHPGTDLRPGRGDPGAVQRPSTPTTGRLSRTS